MTTNIRDFRNMLMPETPAKWQELVDIAEVCLWIDSAAQYGLIRGGPSIDADRCRYYLQIGRQNGYTPRPDAILEKEVLPAFLVRGEVEE